MIIKRLFRASVTILVLVLGLTSCSNLGSVLLPPDRIAYNSSLLNSDEQQVLLNIVRLRYTDPPFFLSVNNVVSQFNFGSNYGLNVSNSSGPPALIGSGTAGYSYSEAPTITYTPMQGEDFINRLLTPVDLSVVYMMLRSGWSIAHVTRLVVQRFGSVDNAVLASRSVSTRVPEYKAFLRVANVFRHLQDTNNIEVRKDLIDNVFAIRLTIKHYGRLTQQERRLLAKFGVTPSLPDMWLVLNPSRAKNQVQIETRSVIGLLNYMSKGVDVPSHDLVTKQARTTYCPDGKPFDWHQVTKYMIRIRTSKAKPTDAYVAVFYKESWFYVPQSDFESKETINLLAIIMGIYQTKVQTSLPVFTVS